MILLMAHHGTSARRLFRAETQMDTWDWTYQQNTVTQHQQVSKRFGWISRYYTILVALLDLETVNLWLMSDYCKIQCLMKWCCFHHLLIIVSDCSIKAHPERWVININNLFWSHSSFVVSLLVVTRSLYEELEKVYSLIFKCSVSLFIPCAQRHI